MKKRFQAQQKSSRLKILDFLLGSFERIVSVLFGWGTSSRVCGLASSLQKIPLFWKPSTIYGKRWNVYVIDSALDDCLKEGKNDRWKEASPNRFFFLSGQMLENREEGRREWERRKSGAEKECQSPSLARDAQVCLCGPGRALSRASFLGSCCFH